MQPLHHCSVFFPFAGRQHRGYRRPHRHLWRSDHRCGRPRLALLRGEEEEAD